MLLVLIALDHVLQVLLHGKLAWAAGVGRLHVLLVLVVNDNCIIILVVMRFDKGAFGILLLVKIVRGLLSLHLLVLVHG